MATGTIKNMEWKLLGTYSDATAHNLPSQFSELLVKTHLTSGTGEVLLTTNIAKMMLNTSGDYYRSGYMGTGNTGAMSSLLVTTTQISMAIAVLNGTQLSNVKYDVYYR